MNKHSVHTPIKLAHKLLMVAMLSALPLCSRAAIPAADQLLPSDTLLMVTAADAGKLRETWGGSPMGQFIADPAMSAIRDKFIARWKEEFLTPLERELGVKVEDYSSLLRGQVTFAVIQNGWKGEKNDPEPATLLLVDTRDKSDQLKTNLSELRRKWVDSGKTIKAESIRNVEFWAVSISSNTMPAALRTFFPQRAEIHELGKEEEPPKADEDLIYIGQHESLLIIGSSISGIEKLLARLTGGSVAPLADEAAFDSSRSKLFRDAPVYAWFNAKRFFGALLAMPPVEPNPEAPSPMPQLSLSKIISASGLGSLSTLGLAWRDSSEGSMLELAVGAPESGRVGFMKILTPEARDSSPPPFVPADVISFQRWRADNQKTLATIEKMISEISPQAINFWNFLLATGNEAGRQDGDEGFDIRKNVFGNLGDDIITYTKSPRGTTPAELAAPPSLVLIGSPNAEQMAGSLKGLLAIVSPSIAPKDREFLGKKIYTVSLARGLIASSGLAGKSLSYAASSGYLAISTDSSTLEEFLRSGETPPKPLREKAGLAEAAEKVGGQSTGLFNYENQSEKMRTLFETLKAGAEKPEKKDSNLDLLAGSVPYVNPQKSFKRWLDYSLLPDFEKVSKYFDYTVYSASANSEGITYKFFTPPPQGLRK